MVLSVISKTTKKLIRSSFFSAKADVFPLIAFFLIGDVIRLNEDLKGMSIALPFKTAQKELFLIFVSIDFFLLDLYSCINNSA